MAEEIEEKGDAPAKKSGLPLLVGLLLAALFGGGGFFAVYSGMILGSGEAHSGPETVSHDEEEVRALPEMAFVPLDPLVINLGSGSGRHLRFRAELEVVPKHESEVGAMLPRVVDVLNSYLRAVSVAELEDPSALIRLRAQMLRRVKIVTGEGRVRDLLIMEFVLN